MNQNQSSEFETSAALRQAIRSGQFTAATAGLAMGYVQTNLVILPQPYAADFALFCQLNPRPCPVVEQTNAGSFVPIKSAADADLRTDVSAYRIFHNGILQADEPQDICDLWQDDLVAFLLGCSFTFENALVEAGLSVRHLEEKRNVPMFRTNIPCQPSGNFSGPMVVSMRPYPPELIDQVVEITHQFPAMHGGPIHIGEPDKIGIKNLQQPDFGDAVTIHPGEVPLFWACGVTPQLAILNAKPKLAITHSPGCMFVTDLLDESFRKPINGN